MENDNQNQPLDPPQTPESPESPPVNSSPPSLPSEPLPSAPPPSRPQVETLEEKLQKMVREEEYLRGVEAQLKAVQESTRTTFPIFAPLHDYLRRRFKPYQKWHLNPHFNQVNVGILIAYTFLIGFFVANQIGLIGPKARSRAAAGIAKVINYQGKLTDTSDVPVADGTYNMKFVIYDAESAGTCLYAARGTCASPAAKSITVTRGIFSTLLGEAGDNVMNLDFNTDLLFLGVAIGSDAEMTPRKRIGSVGYAFNADTVDGAHAGTGVNNVLRLDGAGNITILGGANLGSNTFVVDAAGNKVGVGTASPSSFALQVAGSIGPNSDEATDLGSSALRWRDLYLGPASLHLTSTIGETGTARDWKLNVQTTAGASQGNLRVLEGANELVNITPGGNVGIGAAAPGQKLSVAGTLGIIETGVSPTYYSIFQGGDQAANLTYTLPTAYPVANDYVLASSTAGVLSWVAQGSASGWTDDGTVVRLTTATDNVGIGTTIPGGKLDVKSTQTSGTIGLYGAPAAVTLAGALTGLNLDLSTNYTATGFGVTGQSIALPAVTNSGAGAYAYKGLSVSGGALIQNTAAGTNTWTGLDITMPNITQTTGTVTSTGLKITGGTVTSGTSYGLIIDSNAGNVGIGTANPTANLHIASATYNTQAGIKLAGSSASTILTSDYSAFSIQNTNTTANNYARFDFLDDQSNIAANMAVQYTNHTANAQSANLIFGTRNAGTWSKKLTLSSNGELSLGSSSEPVSGSVAVYRSDPSTVLTTSVAELGLLNMNSAPGALTKIDLWGVTSTGATWATGSLGTINTPGSGLASADMYFAPTSPTGTLTERMRITSGGNVGIGTTSPASLGGFTPTLHLKGLYPSVRLQNDNASTNWEVATLSGGQFTIFGGGGIGNRLVIDTSGRVLIPGTTSAGDFTFQVYQGTNQFSGLFYQSSTNVNFWGMQVSAGTSTASTWGLINFTRQDAVQVGQITHNGTNVTYNSSSDVRLKKDIVNTARGLADLMQIKVRDFKFKIDENNRTFTGYIAQELAPIFPDAVSIPADPDKYWGVDYGRLTPLLVKSIQDQQGEIDGLKTKDDTLQNQINVLQSNISSGITTNNLVVNNSAQFNSSLIVAGAAQFNGTLLVKQAATFEGELLVKGAVTFEKTLLVKDTATFEKDLVVKGNLVLADNNKGINLVIPANSLTYVVVFAAPQADEKYAVSISPSWNTNYWITNKTPAGFSINFNAKPLVDSMLDWMIMR